MILKIRHRKSEFLKELDRKGSDPNVSRQKDWWRLVQAFLKKKSIPPDLPQLDCLLNDITLSFSEVSNIIQNIDKSNATGPDQVHNILLIAASSIIAEPFTILFNRSLSESKFPAIWKVSQVSPLHKKGPKEFCNNYRPISLLSCIGKVFEKYIHKHVFNFLQYNNIIKQSQSGFIPGDSTVNQLICIYNDLCSSFDKGITTQAVHLDICKAFDRMWHRGLYQNWKPSASEGNYLAGFGTIYHFACRLL